MIRYIPWFIVVLLLGTVVLATDDPISVIDKSRQSGEFEIYVHNESPADITISFDLSLENMNLLEPLPARYVVPRGKMLRLIRGKQIRSKDKWSYRYTYHYKWGNPAAQHDDQVKYLLPIKPGTSAKISQGNNGAFSHHGDIRYAVDWEAAPGTGVYATRDGIVLQVIENFDKAGRSIEFKKKANVVSILHSDGTIGNYVHFRKDGIIVEKGNKVKSGQLIGYSGNTGYTTGPHIHFDVNRPRNGNERVTLPITFTTANGDFRRLVEGKVYKALKN